MLQNFIDTVNLEVHLGVEKLWTAFVSTRACRERFPIAQDHKMQGLTHNNMCCHGGANYRGRSRIGWSCSFNSDSGFEALRSIPACVLVVACVVRTTLPIVRTMIDDLREFSPEARGLSSSGNLGICYNALQPHYNRAPIDNVRNIRTFHRARKADNVLEEIPRPFKTKVGLSIDGVAARRLEEFVAGCDSGKRKDWGLKKVEGFEG
ncbi:hypothetical protein C8F04DRAFT_1233438 [Mycena alexandri]|uniref:Uncharacterized protein n=1 Tax=Mycena alexandri TaxID=1745969 RepID=A0AAD6X575_9AGAR|nr:hypothetical protein C8F04DRAFT_1233438 [Mycena alexandri]